MHTWRIREDNPLLRFYVWFWSASPYQVNFCKLFWGLFFGTILTAVFGPFVGAFLSVRWIWRQVPWKVQDALGTAFLVLLTVSALGCVAILIWAVVDRIINNFTQLVDFIFQGLLLFLAVVLALTVITLIAALLKRPLQLAMRGAGQLVRRLPKSRSAVLDALTDRSERVLWSVVGRVSSGAGTVVQASRIAQTPRMIENVWDLLAGFYHAVKYRTCPEIEVV